MSQSITAKDCQALNAEFQKREESKVQNVVKFLNEKVQEAARTGKTTVGIYYTATESVDTFQRLALKKDFEERGFKFDYDNEAFKISW